MYSDMDGLYIAIAIAIGFCATFVDNQNSPFGVVGSRCIRLLGTFWLFGAVMIFAKFVIVNSGHFK
jgi:hypothetical protein